MDMETVLPRTCTKCMGTGVINKDQCKCSLEEEVNA
jgi:DnaJ-class molecular chaperone